MTRARPALLVAALVAGALLAAAPPARAQGLDPSAPEPAPAPADQRPPWQSPPLEADRLRAIELFREGNTLLRDAIFSRAADRYREALQIWDHPAIHFNLAMALVNLDQPVQMREHLVAAIAYGAAPLGEDKFERARHYIALLDQQLTSVELTLDEPGGTLAFDGKAVLIGPGTWRALVPAGEHHVRATAPGKITSDQTLKLIGGEVYRDTVDLYVAIWDDLVGHRRPLPRWAPPSIVAGGVMVGAIGLWFHARGRDSSRAYAEQLAACLPMDPGCGTRPELVGLRNAASSERLAGFTMYGVGATSIALGLILWRYNRLHYYRFDAEGNRIGEEAALTPLVGPDVAGLSAHGTF